MVATQRGDATVQTERERMLWLQVQDEGSQMPNSEQLHAAARGKDGRRAVMAGPLGFHLMVTSRVLLCFGWTKPWRLGYLVGNHEPEGGLTRCRELVQGSVVGFGRCLRASCQSCSGAPGRNYRPPRYFSWPSCLGWLQFLVCMLAWMAAAVAHCLQVPGSWQP